ncbi:phospholipase domain-containing protein [Streptomyces brasiliensis]|uniref:Bacterial phospholipase C C-terminal domain-containing protein n=1 Tax=Streptomyces brasiliensis TaxID=1954 RepID=A0A917L5S4_9ACTN|nr:phospholipase domain-containing protein [Streptomyces brasiliensis]GGJ44440.1 hypothetical protein GCM10010121_064550 [Streptomyces brasiliensis]
MRGRRPRDVAAQADVGAEELPLEPSTRSSDFRLLPEWRQPLVHRPVSFTLTPNDFAGKEQTVWVRAGDRTRLTWRTDDGRYDVTVTAGTGTRFAQRYAGTVHAG